MKKLIFCFFVFVSATFVSNAQDNKAALENCNFLLSTPISKDAKRMQANKSLITWMTDTPDFTFTIEPIVMEKIIGEDSDLLSVYMACMAKYCLENKAQAEDANQVKLNAVKLMIAYCEKPENNAKMSKSFKKIAEANKNGTLEKELK